MQRRSKSQDGDIFTCHRKLAVCSVYKSTSMKQLTLYNTVQEHGSKGTKRMENSTVKSSYPVYCPRPSKTYFVTCVGIFDQPTKTISTSVTDFFFSPEIM